MSKDTHNKIVIFIYGPTASGKTDFANVLGDALPVEIINMDVAQCYTPLTIGTAKADWQHARHRQHMFDIMDQPKRITVAAYRRMALEKIEEIWARGRIPVFVGGSGFYLKSLLFPPEGADSSDDLFFLSDEPAADLWQKLCAVDPERAQQIHPHDLYRVRRALHIWQTTGRKPSEYKPVYQPIAPYIVIHVTQERSRLYTIINQRVIAMMHQGWLEEARALIGTPWQHFVDKGFIGYKELIMTIQEGLDLDATIKDIQQRTRHYAKRQETFWRMLKKEVLLAQTQHATPRGKLLEFDLTSPDVRLYIKQLLQEISLLGCES